MKKRDRDPIMNRIIALGGEGILSREKAAETAASVLSVLELMMDGAWHTPSEIRRAAGFGEVEASEGLRRLRELRDLGWEVEKDKRSEGVWVYRAVRKEVLA